MEVIKVNLDQMKKPSWTQEEINNAEVVVDFIQNLMNNHDFEYIKSQFGKQPYKQHNQSMTDGIGGVLKVVSGVVKRFPDYTYDVKHMYADGDYITAHSHVTTNAKHRGNPKKGFNIMDIWKVENGVIVEHWDAIQPIHGPMRLLSWLTGGKFNNDNTFF
jgi:predicted SnoaL-like aldol condensation-catalyzing enzyme